jgi:hypothetical protein
MVISTKDVKKCLGLSVFFSIEKMISGRDKMLQGGG